MELLGVLGRLVGHFINVVVYEVDASQLFNSKEESFVQLRSEISSKKLPIFKYYPNAISGENKQEEAYKLEVPSS